jgi:hypothetical protein
MHFHAQRQPNLLILIDIHFIRHDKLFPSHQEATHARVQITKLANAYTKNKKLRTDQKCINKQAERVLLVIFEAAAKVDPAVVLPFLRSQVSAVCTK